MKRYVCEYEVYEYDELAKEAQEKAVNGNANINVELDWWDINEEEFKTQLKEAGIEVNGTIYFSIDRDHYAYAKRLAICDPKKLAEAAGFAEVMQMKIDGTVVLDDLDMYLGVESCRNYGSVSDLPGINGKAASEKLTRFIQERMKEYLGVLVEQYNYLTSKEAIEETIRANEMEFYKNGSALNWGEPVKVREKKEVKTWQR